MTELTAERVRELLHYDAESGLFTAKNGWKKGQVVGFFVPPKNYVRLMVDGRQYLAHRLAWLYVYGEWPADQIDHINGVKADNRIENLRRVTPAQNMQNIRAAKSYNKTSGLLGVTRYGAKRWMAQISIKGRNTFIGAFDTPEEAHQAYLTAKRRLHEGCTI